MYGACCDQPSVGFISEISEGLIFSAFLGGLEDDTLPQQKQISIICFRLVRIENNVVEWYRKKQQPTYIQSILLLRTAIKYNFVPTTIVWMLPC